MRRRWVLAAAVVVLVLFAGEGGADTWQGDTGIVSGLGTPSAPTVFQKDSTWYLIGGSYDGTFTGYSWTGSAWQSDSGIVSGLGDIGTYSTPAVFQKGSVWYLIAGEADSSTFIGFNWTGSAWQSDSGIVSGLAISGVYAPKPTTFQKDSTWYLISGRWNGAFIGYNWTGSAWQSDSEIISGLVDIGYESAPTVFQKDSTWYIIAGGGAGVFNGYNWTGSAWQSDSEIISGLVDIGGGEGEGYITPTVFNLNKWYLIHGKAGGGTLTGYNITELTPPTPTNLTHIKNKFWVNHTWDAGTGGVETDSYNVSINGTWHNGTTNTYYNNTLTTYGDWSNVSVYTYNSTYGLSTPVSEDVQLPYPIPAVPAGAGSTWDYYWVNHSWTAGSSYGIWCGDTDSYNVSINGTWHNGTTNSYYNNTGLSPHVWSNASIYAFNDTAGINETYIFQNVQMANRAITITNTSDWSGWASVNVYVDYDATDPDGDTPTFSCNRTDLFTDFSTATGKGNWTAISGTYYVDFGVSDGWGSTSNYTMTITVTIGDGTWYLIAGEEDGGFNGFTWVYTEWVSSSEVVSGLGGIDYSAPTTFQMGGVWYLISGRGNGRFCGYNWTGSTWQSDDGIVSGLGHAGCISAPNVFQKDEVWYFIAGDSDGVFNGYNWTGSTWQSDNVIRSGLGDVYADSAPTVFQKDEVWYLIAGEQDGVFNGFNWDGSTWQGNSGIVGGLGDVGGGSAPTVFQKDDGIWYLIAGERDGVFNGFNWTGSTWQSDSVIKNGLGDVGERSKPVCFMKTETPAPINLVKTVGSYWVNHTWQAGDGVVTDSYNISVNNIWHNNTAEAYYNDTSLIEWGQWSNITAYAYNNTYGLSYSSVSDDVQLLPTLTPHNDFTGDSQLILSPSDRHFTIEFKCTSDMNVKTWTWNGVDTSSGTSNSVETTATKYITSWKGEVSVKASNDYTEMEEITWEYDITPPGYWFDPYYGQRDPILVYSYCPEEAYGGDVLKYYVKIEHVDTTNCVYSDCRDLFFHDARYGSNTYTLPFYTTRTDGSIHRTTDETFYVRMLWLTEGSQTIEMYSGCAEVGAIRSNQFGGYAIRPDDDFEKEFYCIPPCDDSEDLYVNPSTAGVKASMNVRVNESGSCSTNYLSGDISDSVDWSCSDICGAGHIYIYPTVGYAGTACSAYDQDLLLIQPWGAGVGVYIKSKQYNIVEDDDCWVGIGGHNTPIPTDGGTTTDSFSIGGDYGGGITSRLGVYSSWSMSPNGGADIYEIYYGVSQDPNPCWVETVFRYYDYMMVVFYDDSGNLINNADVAIHDTTDNRCVQKWETENDGVITFRVEDYSGHTLQIVMKTFDGVFVYNVYVDPEGGVTNRTVPIHYNVKVYPVDEQQKPLTDVFAGLAEYTAIAPQAFWGYSMTGSQYVPITNCSGFAMCDLIAEKGGYVPYNVTALNWSSKSALVKDYRHTATLIKQ